MKAKISILIDKPFPYSTHLPDVGYFSVETKDGKEYNFDFIDRVWFNSEGCICAWILNHHCSRFYPESEDFRKHIAEVVKINNVLYTDLHNNTKPVLLMKLIIVDELPEGCEEPTSTEFVQVEKLDNNSYSYTFTDKLLDTFKYNIIEERDIESMRLCVFVESDFKFDKFISKRENINNAKKILLDGVKEKTEFGCNKVSIRSIKLK